MNQMSEPQPRGRERVVVALLDTFFPRSRSSASDDSPSSLLAPEELQEYYAYSGSDFPGIVLKILEIIEIRIPKDNARELLTLFWLLNTRFGTLLLSGRGALGLFLFPTAFPDLPVSSREQILLGWAHSSSPKFKKAFVALKGVFLSAIFTWLDPNGASPILKALLYQITDPQRPLRPLPQALEAERSIAAALIDLTNPACNGSQGGVTHAAAAFASKRLPPYWPRTSRDSISPAIWRSRPAFVVTCDAIIVGSGAGGGVTAARLAAAGLRVIVLEKAGFVPAQEMTQREGESFEVMMESGGLMASESGAITILAGSTLGGGTRINWNASFKTPPHVRREWAEEYGLAAFGGEEFSAALDAVCGRLGVKTGFAHGGACSALAAGLQEAGMHCGEVPRNCVDTHCSGHCCFGCARGAKQDTTNTFLADACSTGAASIVTGAYAETIITQKAAKGSEARLRGRSKEAVGVVVRCGSVCNPLRFAVSAPMIISAAGALHTPALLLRSGITCGGNVGSNLRLHPCTCVVGVFPPDVAVPPFLGETGGGVAGFAGATAAGSIRCSEGPIMSVFSRQAGNWNSTGYGCILYTPATHPGLFSAAAPWLGGKQYKDLMLQYPNAVPVLVLVRDTSDSGRVKIDKEGRPRMHYDIGPKDKEAMMQGMQLGLQALVAAGASSVMTLLNSENGRFDVQNSKDANDPAFLRFCEGVEKDGVPDLGMQTFSAHQMGTARLGVVPESSVLDSNGECWEAAGLFCCDGSTFPTSLGVNPMITIESVAYLLAERMAQRALRKGLCQEKKGRGARRMGVVSLEYEEEAEGSLERAGVATAKL